MITTSTPAATPPPVTPIAESALVARKPFHLISEEYVGALLAEIIAYQKRDAAYKTLTNSQIPDRDLKAAIGKTNAAHEIYRSRLAEEKAAQPSSPSKPA